MRDDFFKQALEIVKDPYILANMILARIKMLRSGRPPLVESVETLSLEDVAMREIIEGQITYILGDLVVLDEIVGLKRTLPRSRDELKPAPPAGDDRDSSWNQVQTVAASAMGAPSKRPRSLTREAFAPRRNLAASRLERRPKGSPTPGCW